MNNPNIKVYLGISFALIILFILILIIPFSKKISPQKTTTPSLNQPFPTSVETNQQSAIDNQQLTIPASDFTGVAEEELPPEVLDASLQKKDLRQKTPLDLSTFAIDFDYNEDKFVVTLLDPKDQAQKEFENWRTTNYPGLGSDQFLFR
jgi:hypothetical protein